MTTAKPPTMPLGRASRYMAATTTTVIPRKTGQLMPLISMSAIRIVYP